MQPKDLKSYYNRKLYNVVLEQLNITGVHLEVFTRRYSEGKCAKEIAKDLNISIHTVYKIQASNDRKLAFINLQEAIDKLKDA